MSARSARLPAGAAWICRCRAHRRSARATRARRRRRARDRTRRCPSSGARRRRCRCRRTAAARRARRGCTASRCRRPPPRRVSAARSSTSEFQAPHSGQRPSHFCDCAPHSWQAKTVLFSLSCSFSFSCQLPAFNHAVLAESVKSMNVVAIPATRPPLIQAGSWQLKLEAMIHAFYPRSDPAEQFVRNRSDRRGNFAYAERFRSLFSQDDDFVTGCTSVPVTSIVVMSMQTEPTIGARRPRTSMEPRRPAGDRDRPRNRPERPRSSRADPRRSSSRIRAFARAQSFDRHDTAME